MKPELKETERRSIRVLLLEDRPIDAELMVKELRRSGFDPDWRRVDTQAGFAAELSTEVELILADYHIPGFNALKALRLVQDQHLDIPFIVVSGALGDELAVRCIKEGVTDYLLKDRMERLGLAVIHALEERRLRTERHAMDEQLRHAQKMEVTGQLAGGIAHDFNNVLCVINGWASLLLDNKALPADTHAAIRQIYTAGARAESLTRQLLYFSSKRPVERRLLDLNWVIADVAKMLQRLIGEDYRFETALEPETVLVEADPTMMEQILFNLAANARDAMKPHGLLVIGTAMIELSDASAKGRLGARPGRFACLSARDNGSGIAPDVLPRIFEPFFTTKAAGKGTGLGLATVFGIVNQHGGWLEVDSQVDVGTTFRVFLPAASPDAILVSPKYEEQGAPITGGHEMVLVVEDEASVRDYVVATLQPNGYKVLQARGGSEALAVWKRHRTRVELLITDVVMGDDMSGPELASQLIAENPSLEVLFTSGYSPQAIEDSFKVGRPIRLLHKPYSPRALLAEVREALDARKIRPTASASP